MSIVRRVSATETGSSFISPEEIDAMKYTGSIFVTGMGSDEIIGFVYHDTDAETWTMETIDFVSGYDESFLDLFNYYADEDFNFIVKG